MKFDLNYLFHRGRDIYKLKAIYHTSDKETLYEFEKLESHFTGMRDLEEVIRERINSSITLTYKEIFICFDKISNYTLFHGNEQEFNSTLREFLIERDRMLLTL